jgi:hypothetical protein
MLIPVGVVGCWFLEREDAGQARAAEGQTYSVNPGKRDIDANGVCS